MMMGIIIMFGMIAVNCIIIIIIEGMYENRNLNLSLDVKLGMCNS